MALFLQNEQAKIIVSIAIMKGKIASVDNNKRTLVVNVAIFGCDTKVDAEFDQVSIIEDNDEQK